MLTCCLGISLLESYRYGRLSQARGPGCFAWHHEAPAFPWVGRESTPASLCGNPANPFLQGFLPADAAGARPPGPQATILAAFNSFLFLANRLQIFNLSSGHRRKSPEPVTFLQNFIPLGMHSVQKNYLGGLGGDVHSLQKPPDRCSFRDLHDT